MTVRVYLKSATLAAGPAASGDLPAERFFVHASEVPEVWVETECRVPERGRAVAFFFARPMGLGFERVTGTIERTVAKRAGARLGAEVATASRVSTKKLEAKA